MKSWTMMIVLAAVAAIATGLNPSLVIAQDDEEKADACRATVVQRFSTHPTNTLRRPHYSQMVLWSVFGAKQVELRHEGQDEWKPVDNVGFELIKPTHDVRYWLRVTNAEDWTFETSTLVDVDEYPTTLNFSVEPRQINKGESALIRWETIHTDYVVMEEVVGDPATTPIPRRTLDEMENEMDRFPATGELTVTPDQTTTYSFYGFSKRDRKADGAVGWTLTVTVIE